MKHTGIIFLFLSLSIILNGQEDAFETIGKGNGNIIVSGFAGPTMSFTRINGQFAHMMGGGAAVIINDFFFGGYGMGKTTELEYKGESSNLMTYGYGGLWLGYTFFQKKAIHPVLHTQVGWGAIGKKPKNYTENTEATDVDQVFVVCPTFELEMNFSHFFKLGAGVNYNLIYNTGEAVSPYTTSDFANMGVFLSLKFGWFK